MEEVFVTYQQGVELKRLGFDWYCDHYYTKEDSPVGCMWLTVGVDANYNEHYVAAPALHVAAKWLRDVLGWHISVNPEYDGTWYFHICPVGGANEEGGDGFKTYEDALSAGITEILKAIE